MVIFAKQICIFISYAAKRVGSRVQRLLLLELLGIISLLQFTLKPLPGKWGSVGDEIDGDAQQSRAFPPTEQSNQRAHKSA